MKFYQLVQKSKNRFQYDDTNIIWLHSFECNFSLVEINKLISDTPEHIRSYNPILGNHDITQMRNTGWTPMYWCIYIDNTSECYEHNLYCMELFHTANNDNYTKLVTFLREKVINNII
jgi:hypothetical protein